MDIIKDIEIGKDAPKIVNAIIEIPKNSSIKYEIDKKTGLLMLDRMLFTANHYPGDYGLIPRTHCGDGDPLDVIILTDKSLLPLTLAEVRVIGIVRMIDDNEQDDKIIGVYEKDPRFAEYKNLEDIPDHVIKEIKHFFETYKELQNKEVKITDMQEKTIAYEEIEKAQKLYLEKFENQ